MSQSEPFGSSEVTTPADTKRHASCDECRARKLKCSGEVTGCARCLREQITCHYSGQKRMGRPRKRRRNVDEESTDDVLSTILNNGLPPEQAPVDIPLEHTPWENHSAGSDVFGLAVIPFPSALEDDSTILNTMGFDDIAAFPDSTHHESLGQPANASQTPCACLDTLYLTLSSLQPYAASSTSLVFPIPLLPMRKAINTGYTVLQCTQCPSLFASSLQSLMLLITLLQLLAVCYSNMIQSIDREASALSDSGGRKKFRMGDMSDGTAGMHTGTLECPMAFEIELSANEWRTMAKKVVVNDVRGADGKGGLMGLLSSMEERQRERHRSRPTFDEGNEVACKLMNQTPPPNGDYTCLRVMDHARKVLEAIDLD
ncbi:MAG: hypothetical protein M1812_001682 [Candelaria pacifica]|nr:MAG: hypothetical protein M1812_001682 [Candelaria pacifica]